MINLQSALELNHIPPPFPPITNLVAILDSARMIGVNHGYANPFHCLRSALVHRLNLFGAFFLQPETQFVNAYYFWIVFLRELNGIADVIAMTMCAKHQVNLLEALLVIRARGIVHDPWIDQNRLTRSRFNV